MHDLGVPYFTLNFFFVFGFLFVCFVCFFPWYWLSFIFFVLHGLFKIEKKKKTRNMQINFFPYYILVQVKSTVRITGRDFFFTLFFFMQVSSGNEKSFDKWVQAIANIFFNHTVLYHYCFVHSFMVSTFGLFVQWHINSLWIIF